MTANLSYPLQDKDIHMTVAVLPPEIIMVCISSLPIIFNLAKVRNKDEKWKKRRDHFFHFTFLNTNSFSTHIPDIFFQHFNNIIMYVSSYEMKEKTISNTIFIVIKLDWRIYNPLKLDDLSYKYRICA